MPVVLPRAAANNVRCVGSSGDLPPPSPPAEKATTSQDQAWKASTSDGTGYSRRGYRNPDRTTDVETLYYASNSVGLYLFPRSRTLKAGAKHTGMWERERGYRKN